MERGESRATALSAAACAAIVFVSAFLLFQVQPLISKTILPWFGGSPAVWSCCLVFFQTALVGGYAYAHWQIRSRWIGKYWLHAGLLVAAFALLPITPSAGWKPPDGSQPTLRILTLLAATVGLPYFLLSSTGPLVQAWFARLAPERTPYRLYALSNVGSLLALLSYPFVFEPNISLRGQGWGWSAGFAFFAVMSAGLLFYVRKHAAEEPPLKVDDEEETPTTLTRRAIWILLPALASAALVAVTNHLCQDIAVVPFFWVVPLSVYLLSFILCFERAAWYRPLMVVAALLAVTAFIQACDAAETLDKSLFRWGAPAAQFSQSLNAILRPIDPQFHVYDWEDSRTIYAGAFLVWFFALSILCHGEVYRLRPARRGLTEFYLLIAVGGAAGGSLVTLVCPLIFTRYYELPICVAIGAIAAAAVVIRAALASRTRVAEVAVGATGVAIAGMLWGAVLSLDEQKDPTLIAQMRDFYGTISIHNVTAEDPADNYVSIFHGHIQHGLQFTDEFRRDEPTTYYVPTSGIGVALRRYPGRNNGVRIGVVGLGSGGMAAHARQGDVIRFYEIDPQVIDIAHRYFSYCSRCQGKVEIISGDARLSMEREPPQEYDILVLDAFTGDAIPVHLLTKEAFDVYARHLKPGGILATHISNRYLDLRPVILGAAKHLNCEARLIELQYGKEGIGEANSDWMLITDNEAFLSDPLVAAHVSASKMPPSVLWTDQRNDLLRILRIGR